MPPETVIAYLHFLLQAVSLYVQTRRDPPGIVLRRFTYLYFTEITSDVHGDKPPPILKRPENRCDGRYISTYIIN